MFARGAALSECDFDFDTSLKLLYYSAVTIGNESTSLKCIYLQNVIGSHFDLVERVQ